MSEISIASLHASLRPKSGVKTYLYVISLRNNDSRDVLKTCWKPFYFLFLEEVESREDLKEKYFLQRQTQTAYVKRM